MSEKVQLKLKQNSFHWKLKIPRWRVSKLKRNEDGLGHYETDIQGVRKVSLQFVTKANEKTGKWKLLQNETYIFQFLFLFFFFCLFVSFSTPLYGLYLKL